MSRAIVVAFHQYTPMGKEFYDPMFKFFMKSMMARFNDEFETLYLIDSTWRVKGVYPKTKVIEVNPSLRYYDAYKHVLPQIEEDLVLFMDNDMLVWKDFVIDETFTRLEDGAYDVVSIYDTIGEFTSPALHGKSKFCPYWFASKKDLLMKYLDVNWGPRMPYSETLGLLTQNMLLDGVRPFEQEEDKSNILIDGTKDGEISKHLGYYHVRAGSTPAYLLATKQYGDKNTYWKYIKEQPRTEYLRQCMWYEFMGGNAETIIKDSDTPMDEWNQYKYRFKDYYGLI